MKAAKGKAIPAAPPSETRATTLKASDRPMTQAEGKALALKIEALIMAAAVQAAAANGIRPSVDPALRLKWLERAKKSAVNKATFWADAATKVPAGTKRERSALNKARFWAERAKEIAAKIAAETAAK